jgi:acetyl-CoA carboxylase carboxyl transferase subunit beta
MNSIKDLLPGSMRERTFQLKARRDAGAVWNDPQFVECKKCGRRATRQIWNKAQYVCPNCGVHLPIGGYYRLSLILDKGSFRELDADLAPQDVLQFPGYPEKLEAQTGKTGLKEAVITATGRIEGTPVVVAVLDSRFFMGSMSTTVGEKITRAVEHAAAKHLPLIIFSASGGARMQEGIFSLMQMAKTTGVIAKLAEHKLPFISVLTDPTMGGVSASFAFMGDVVMAEPKALIGFAGPRVIEQTVREQLPEGFQRSEFLLQKGAIDMIVDRKNLKMEIAKLIALFQKESLDAIE